jgi:hypothetical protein
MKKYLVAAGCALAVTFCFGQSAGAGRNGWKFRSEENVGMAFGEMGGYGLVETINGLYKGSWFLGLGAGVDYYRFRSVPLFVSVTRDLPVGPKKHGLYVFANGGINLPWYNRDPLPDGIGTSQFHPGIWWNTGLGYKWKLSSQSDKALLVSASYGLKKLSEHQVGAYPPGAPIDCPACLMLALPRYDYEYVNRVLLFSVGFQF